MKRSYILPHFAATGPAVPGNLIATAVSSSQINLSWSASAGPNLKDYGVYRIGTGLLGYVVGATISDTGLTPSTTYVYYVTARNVGLIESGPSGFASATTQSSGTLTHGQPFTVTGVNLGTKSRSLTWLLADKGTDPVGTISSQYDSFSPNNVGMYAPYNALNKITSFNPTGSLIGTPHPYVGAIVGGATAIPFGSGDYQFWVGKHFTLPTLPCVLYASWYQRSNPDWSFGIGSPVDYNYKFWDYSSQNAPATGNNYYMAFDVGGPTSNVAVSRQVNITDDSTVTIQNPDGNGHNNFWGNALSPFHAANGWVKCEVEIFISTATGLGGGTIVYKENNGTPIITYAGRTDNFGGTSRYFYVGAYNRDYPSANNWRCCADLRFDITGTVSVGAHCARLMVGNANTLAGCTILEPADITVWSNTGATFNFWKGSLPSLSTGYFYAFTEAGTVVIPTPASAAII